MPDKIDNMPKGQWQPVGISAHQITLFRASVLSLLGLIALGGLLTGQYKVGIVSLFSFIIMLCVFAVKRLYDYEYRGQHDSLHTSKVTTLVPLEIAHEHAERKTSSIIMKVQTNVNPNPIWIRLTDYQASKVENQNIAIYGMNGTGKTTLGLRLLAQSEEEYQKIVIGYKRKDTGRYQKLGYQRWDMREHRPDPFSNKDAFVRALVVAIDLDSQSGITANSIRDLVEDLVRKSSSWPELFLEIKANIKQAGYDNITRLALARIERALKVIYDPRAEYFTIPSHNIFLDYAEVKNRTINTFDSEFLLELLYDEIISGQRNQVIIYIDECHRLLRNRYESGSNVSIIEDLISREIRDTGSRLWICTQSYQDVNPTARDQFATQYIFRTFEPKTMLELRGISDLLDQAVTDLDSYNFVDVGQSIRGVKVRQAVYHFRLYPKTVEEPVPRPTITSEPTTTVTLVRRAPPSPRPAALPSSPNYLMKIAAMLGEAPMTTQEVATQLVVEEQRPKGASADWKPSSEQISAMKLKIKDCFLQLLAVHDGELAGVLLLQDEYRDKPKSLYYLKDKGEKWVHARLTAITKAILLEHYAAEKIIDGKDRISEVDFEIPNRVIEVESGLRRGNTRDLEDRIKEATKLGSKINELLIVVPNDETKKKYRQFIREGEVNVLVLYELGYHLDQQNNPATAKEIA